MKKKSSKKKKQSAQTKQPSTRTEQRIDRVVDYEEDSYLDRWIKSMDALGDPRKIIFALSFIEMSGAKLRRTPWGFAGRSDNDNITYFVDQSSDRTKKLQYTRDPSKTVIGNPSSFGRVRMMPEQERKRLDILDISSASSLMPEMFDIEVCRQLGSRWLTSHPIMVTPHKVDPDAYTRESRATYRYLRDLSKDPNSGVKRKKFDKCESFTCVEIGIPFLFDRIELKFWDTDDGFLVLEDNGEEWSITLYLNRMQSGGPGDVPTIGAGIAWQYKSKKRVVSFDVFCYNKNLINSMFTDSSCFYFNGGQYIGTTAWHAMLLKRLDRYGEAKEIRSSLAETGVFGVSDLEVLEDPMMSPDDDCFAMYSMLGLDAVSVVMSYAIVANYIVSCRAAASHCRQGRAAKLEQIRSKVAKAQKIAMREGISTDEVLNDERYKGLTPREQKLLEDAQIRTAEKLTELDSEELEGLINRSDGLEALSDSNNNGRILRVVNISPPMEKAVRKHVAYTKRKEAEYTTAAWGCIGHFRTTKTGKRVWVNPSIRHRQKPLTYSETARTLYRPSIRLNEEM